MARRAGDGARRTRLAEGSRVASRCTREASHVQPTQALPLVEQRIVVLPRSAAGASFARPVAVERPAGLVEALTRAKERSEAAAPAEPLMEAHPALARAAKGPTKALSAVAVWDSLSRRRDHGLKLPEGITQAVFASADSHISEKLRAQYGGEEGVALAQIVVGQLVLAMVDELTRAAERPHELEHKLSVWAAHDTTMIPVLVILGCYDFLWPPIASELRLELWECHEHEEHLVRVVFNDKPLKLPFAAARDDFCEVSMLCQALRAKMPDTRASL